MASEFCLGCFEQFDSSISPVCPHCGYVKGTPPKEAYHIIPGNTLKKRYIVGKVIGYGGFGITYIGYDILLETKVAIKEYLPSDFSTRMPGTMSVSVYDGDAAMQFKKGADSFVEEARRLAKFNDVDGIVDIYDTFVENGTAYIVMEYLEGKTVKELLKGGGKMTFDEACSVILPILGTLETVHQAGIIHRDVAPDNIFITKTGEIKLLDFGAARYASSTYSKSMSVLYKAGYTPEEQYRSRGEQGPWSDVYATAATMYRMITGKVPDVSLERAAKETLVPPSKLGVKISKNAENALLNAMNVPADQRTRSAKEFEEALLSETEVIRNEVKIEKVDVGRMPLWTKLVAVFGVVLVTAAIFYVLTINGAFSGLGRWVRGEMIVPDYVGMTETEMSITNRSRLTIDSDNRISDDKSEFDEGIILAQSLDAGSVVHKRDLISFTVSAGPEMNMLPDLRYYSGDEALALIGGEGFKYPIIDYVSSSEAGAGTVLKMTVKDVENDADIVPINKTVVLSVVENVIPASASVQDEVNIPEISGESFEYAMEKLMTAGLYIGKTGTTGMYNDEGANYYVDELQNGLREGQSVPRGTVVFVSLTSDGAVMFALPAKSIVGGNSRDVIAEIQEIGFKVEVIEEYSDTIAEGKVIGYGDGFTQGGRYSSDTTVTVKVSKGKSDVKVTSVKINGASSVNVGESISLNATIKPDEAANVNVQWTSSDSSVATVTRGGRVTGVKAGKVTVTAVADGVSDSKTVTVNAPVAPEKPKDEDKPQEQTTTQQQTTQQQTTQQVEQPTAPKLERISISASSTAIKVGDTTKLSVKITPSTISASDCTVSWRSSNTGFASVDSGGTVRGKSKGSVTITATVSYGGVTKTDEITITMTEEEKKEPEPVALTSVTINAARNVAPEVGQVYSDIIVATLTPANAAYSKVEWHTSDSAVVNIGGKNKLTATLSINGTGTASIWATVDGIDSNKMPITISQQKAQDVLVTEISLKDRSITLTEGSSSTVGVNVYPSNATNRALRWSVDNESVATIDSNGNINAKSPGTTSFTVKSTDGSNISQSGVITVNPKVSIATRAEISPSSVSMSVGDKGTVTCYYDPDDGSPSEHTFKWSVSGDAVSLSRKINNKCDVIAESAGTVTLTVTVDGNVTATCRIVVTGGGGGSYDDGDDDY